VISLWELSMKSKSGKLRIPPDFFSTINREDFRILPFEMNHALEAGNLPLHHKDPFDRALIGQAKCERFRLVTADRTLVAYKNEIEIFEVW
jgi:PIN domain nuclease of toxin-antitoxin system